MPAGLAAALRLHTANSIAVVVYETREQPTTLGGAVSIPANGLRFLHRLGVYEPLRRGGSVTPEIIVHSTSGNELGRLDLASDSKAAKGYELLCIKRTVLMDALVTAAHAQNIPIHFGKNGWPASPRTQCKAQQ